MASLTETSILARKGIRYAIYLLIFGLVARFTFNLAFTIYRRIFPPPPPELTYSFGKQLPLLPFPQKKVPENLSYKIETPEGSLPKFIDQLPVYLMPPVTQNIQALDNAKEVASQLLFNPDGKPLLESTPNVRLFRKDRVPSSLTMNIITGVFSISYDLSQDPSLLGAVAPAPEQAKTQIQSFLQGAKLLPDDLEKATSTEQFYKIEANQFKQVDSQSEANVTKVNLFRKNYGPNDSLPPVTPKMPESNVWFMMSGSGYGNIVAGEYHYYAIDATKSGTYPIKTSQEALDSLEAGKGFIARIDADAPSEITIRKIYLAYYDPGQFAEYYQPVAVFEGDNNFIAYVPAVKDENYGMTSTENSQ